MSRLDLGIFNKDRIAVAHSSLLDENRIGARRHRGAGEDPHGLAWPDPKPVRRACRRPILG